MAEHALLQVLRARRIEPKNPSIDTRSREQAGAVSAGENDAAGGEVLAESEAFLWTFADAFEAGQAIRILEDAGIWNRMWSAGSMNGNALSGRPRVELSMIVQRADYARAVALLQQRMGLFPSSEAGDAASSPLQGMGQVGLVALFDRADGLAAAEALGRAGISYFWRDGKEEAHDLPDAGTVAIEVRTQQMERALEIVEQTAVSQGTPQGDVS